jgi:predicted amidophosphoribosyltransferase
MTWFFCPRCWSEFRQDHTRCPHCGFDIAGYQNSADFVDKLIRALRHPEPSMPIRATWILGKRKERRAVNDLIALARETPDLYLCRVIVRALGEIGTPEAMRFLETIRDHPAKIISEEIRRILDRQNQTAETSSEPNPQKEKWQ